MKNKEKLIVNEAIAIIAGECKKSEWCDECALYQEKEIRDHCPFRDTIIPKDWKAPFPVKKERHWLSGKEVEVLDNG